MNHSEETSHIRLGLAEVRNAPSIEERLQTVERIIEEAHRQATDIVCFPEALIPGLRGQGFVVPPPDQRRQEFALAQVRAAAERFRVAVVIGMEWETAVGLHNVAFVISEDGEILGYQAKNQIPPEEEPFYVPDGQRRIFKIRGVPLGVAICHEGWRYPETVRWAAVRGARIVFHPQLTGSDDTGAPIRSWGDPRSPYYEKAMVVRAIENTIYFASVNYAMRYQESATSLIGPDGSCLAHVPYGQEQLLVHDIDVTLASGFYARRLNPALYPVE